MPQTFYIEADEEIISVVGRLRHTTDPEVTLVVPKRAILSQSVVSLKLLEREAKKLGKHVIIVTQDNGSRALAEKAGLETRPYQEELDRREKALQNTPSPSLPAGTVSVGNLVSDTAFPAQFSSGPKSYYAVKAESIGSEEFFQGGKIPTTSDEHPPQETSHPTVPSPLDAGPMQVRIRDNSPKYQTALNSLQPGALKQTPAGEEKTFPQKTTIPTTSKESFSSEKISSFFSPKSNPPIQGRPLMQKEPSKLPEFPTKEAGKPIGKRSQHALLLLAGTFVLLVGGIALFTFRSSVEVTLIPYSERESTAKFEFKLVPEGKNSEASSEFELPYQSFEEMIEVSVPIEATGSAPTEKGSDRARGKIVIYNNYGTEPQTLVSTTRFETPDGKIFRLAQGVIVPGMTEISGKKEPGAIEAQVVADQPGAEYNIGPSSFTIPGFKGGPKYEKFSAKSSSAMVGGGGTNTSGKSITVSDIEQARSLAKEKAKESFRVLLSEKTGNTSSRILDEGIELTLTTEEPSLVAGMSGENLSPKFRFQGKAFVLSDEHIREAIRILVQKNNPTGKGNRLPLSPQSILVNTVSLEPDFKENAGRATLSVDIVLAAHIDIEAVKGELSGVEVSALKEVVLDKHPEINQIDIVLHPEFKKTLPSDTNRIEVRVADPSEK